MAILIDIAPCDGSYHRAGQIDEEQRAQHRCRQRKRRLRQIKIDIGEGGDQREEHAESDGVGGKQKRITEMLADRHPKSSGWRPAFFAFNRHEAPDRKCGGQIQDAQHQKHDVPIVMRRNESGEEAAKESTDDCAADVRSSSAPGFRRSPFVVDVSDSYCEDAGSKHALQEAPEEQGIKAIGEVSGQSGECESEGGEDDGFFASNAVRNTSGHRGGERHAESAGRDREAGQEFADAEGFAQHG